MCVASREQRWPDAIAAHGRTAALLAAHGGGDERCDALLRVAKRAADRALEEELLAHIATAVADGAPARSVHRSDLEKSLYVWCFESGCGDRPVVWALSRVHTMESVLESLRTGLCSSALELSKVPTRTWDRTELGTGPSSARRRWRRSRTRWREHSVQPQYRFLEFRWCF